MLPAPAIFLRCYGKPKRSARRCQSGTLASIDTNGAPVIARVIIL
jgi:hypothetical protein